MEYAQREPIDFAILIIALVVFACMRYRVAKHDLGEGGSKEYFLRVKIILTIHLVCNILLALPFMTNESKKIGFIGTGVFLFLLFVLQSMLFRMERTEKERILQEHRRANNNNDLNDLLRKATNVNK